MAQVIYINTTSDSSSNSKNSLKIKRVAAYARVSTDSNHQASSFTAQVTYYTQYIQNHEGWEFVAVYTDEGISGTSTKKREGFKAMIADALSGKIDLIITKSISRFARNTVDTLTAIRELRAKKVEVHFEKENIWTLDGKGELLLTIMSSLAQEESRSISENVTWGIRKRFAEGKVSAPFKAFLGYDKGFKINEEQAKTVQYIFNQFLQGDSYHQIAQKLKESGVKTATGKINWSPDRIKYILTNEKYKGDALLQKGYSADFLTKKRIVNNGELPRYYVCKHHDPIIDSATFDQVQLIIERQRSLEGGHKLRGRIICSECGGFYEPITSDNSLWRCHSYFLHPHFLLEVTEAQIKEVFKSVFKENKLLYNCYSNYLIDYIEVINKKEFHIKLKDGSKHQVIL